MSSTVELRIARWISHFVGGSYLALATLFAVIYLLAELTSGNFSILKHPTTITWAVCTIVYAYALFQIVTIEGKNRGERTKRWLVSIVAHTGILLYLCVAIMGTAALVVGIPESIIIALSLVGLFMCRHDKVGEH